MSTPPPRLSLFVPSSRLLLDLIQTVPGMVVGSSGNEQRPRVALIPHTLPGWFSSEHSGCVSLCVRLREVSLSRLSPSQTPFVVPPRLRLQITYDVLPPAAFLALVALAVGCYMFYAGNKVGYVIQAFLELHPCANGEPQVVCKPLSLSANDGCFCVSRQTTSDRTLCRAAHVGESRMGVSYCRG